MGIKEVLLALSDFFQDEYSITVYVDPVQYNQV
jgi:hypothetical protein